MILSAIAEQLRRWYRLDGLPPIEPFLIDEPTARRLLGPDRRLDGETRELLLVGHNGRDLEIALHVAPSVLTALQRANPFVALHEENLAPFCTAVEGISHLCCVLWKFTNGVPVSQLELEIQAEVDKFLCCAWLRQAQDAPPMPLQEYLFVRYRLAEGCSAEAARRYHVASRLGGRYCRALQERYLTPHRVGALRRTLPAFYRLSHWQKLRLLSAPVPPPL